MRTSRLVLAVAIGVGGWYLLRGGASPGPAGAPQLAVMPGGFTVMQGAGTRRLIDLDRTGAMVREVSLSGLPAEARVAGHRRGKLVGWRDGAHIHLAAVATDGRLGETRSFGKRAVAMCDGVASNGQRFGMGWREADGSVWVLSGPASATGDLSGAAAAILAPPDDTWCAVASIHDKVAVIWRQHDTLYMSWCGKRCPPLPGRVRGPVSERPVLAFGCARTACVIATRDGRGALHVTWVTESGVTKTDRTLPARRDSAVAIVGAGDRQVAIGYQAEDGHPVVVRLPAKGAPVPVWRGEPGPAPALAWADRVLAIVYLRGEHLVSTAVAM